MKATGLVLGAALAFAAATTAAQANTVTVNFSGLPDGSAVGNTYSGLGLTFSPNAVVGTCDTGCPLPNIYGNFVYTTDGSEFTADFATAQDSISFQSVSFSSTLAQAYNASDALVASLDDEQSFPATSAIDTLSGPGITHVTFTYDGGYNGPAVTNLTFNASAVPEPGIWAMMLAGVAMIGGALRFNRKRGAALATA